jgi:excisionase family DNA binding protein
VIPTPHHNGASLTASSLDAPSRLSLDAIASAPSPTEALSKLSPDALAVLSGRCATIQSAIQLAITGRAATTPVAPAPALTEPPRLLAAHDIAQRTGFARSYVYELIRSGSLRAVKVGKYCRVTESALAEWIAQHETQAR